LIDVFLFYFCGLGPSRALNGRRTRLAYPPGYLPESTSYQLYPRHSQSSISGTDDAADKETLLERLRRLRLEAEEVEEELEAERSRTAGTAGTEESAAGGEGAAGNEEKKEAGRKKRGGGEPTPAMLLAQLRYLRGDLTRLSGEAEKLERLMPGESDGGTGREERASALLARLGSQRNDDETGEVVVDQLRRAAATGGGGQTDSSALGRLDDRLVRLEKFVGANEADVDEVRAYLYIFIACSLCVAH
jgi:nuclear migration protein JNM1